MIKKQNNLDCVMPAAGLSSRMGSWKMMLAYRQHTILDESIKNALHFCSRVILVAGHRSDELVERYRSNQNVLVIVNPDYSLGMFSSIQLGVSAVDSDHFFICHGDMPCIGADIYQQIWNMRGDFTVFPGSEENSGHPVLLPRTLIPSIVGASTSQSMKPLIKWKAVKYLGLNCDEIHLDVDTPKAYQAIISDNQR